MHALTLAAAARMSHAARKNLVLASVGVVSGGGSGGAGSGGGGDEGGDEQEGRLEGGAGGKAGAVMRVSYITVTPDVDQSSNRGYR
jgi:hypothetical protein